MLRGGTSNTILYFCNFKSSNRHKTLKITHHFYNGLSSLKPVYWSVSFPLSAGGFLVLLWGEYWGSSVLLYVKYFWIKLLSSILSFKVTELVSVLRPRLLKGKQFNHCSFWYRKWVFSAVLSSHVWLTEFYNI